MFGAGEHSVRENLGLGFSMEADRGKLFVGGIGRDTTVEQLREYFERYGEVSNASIVKDKVTGRPRGFGFVSFSDPLVIDRVLKIKHVVGKRTVCVSWRLIIFHL